MSLNRERKVMGSHGQKRSNEKQKHENSPGDMWMLRWMNNVQWTVHVHVHVQAPIIYHPIRCRTSDTHTNYQLHCRHYSSKMAQWHKTSLEALTVLTVILAAVAVHTAVCTAAVKMQVPVHVRMRISQINQRGGRKCDREDKTDRNWTKFNTSTTCTTQTYCTVL